MRFIGRKYSKLIIIGVVLILVAGTIVGLSNQNQESINNGPELSAAPAANIGFAPSLGSNHVVQGQPQNQPLSSCPAMTITASTTASLQSEPNTIGINSNPGQQPQSNPNQTQNNTSNGGFIEFFSNVTLRVGSSQPALQKASAVAYSFGGYVAYSALSNTTAIAVLRIPSSNYQGALGEIEALGNLTGFTSTSNDVSIKYTDLNATLQSLLTEQASLLRLENKSTSLNDTLLLESQLQGVNAQINEIQSQILQTRLLIDYATITSTLYQETTSRPLSLKVTATPRSGLTPLSVTFNAIVAGGSPPYIVNYNFGDGTSWQGQSLIHTFTQEGTFNVTITVTDSSGNVQESWMLVKVSSPSAMSAFSNFMGGITSLFLSVLEGIAEVAVVVIPIALVAGAVILPLRGRMRSSQKEAKAPNS